MLTAWFVSLGVVVLCERVLAEGGGVAPQDPLTFCEAYKEALDRFAIYRSDTGFLRSFAFTGRYQGQFQHVSRHVDGLGVPAPGLDDNDTDWFARRFRFGFKAEFLDAFTLLADFNLDPTWTDEESRFACTAVGDPDENGRRRGEVGFVQNLFQVQFKWKLSDRATLIVGSLSRT